MREIIAGSLSFGSIAFLPVLILVFYVEFWTALPVSLFIFTACMLLYWLEKSERMKKPRG